MKNKISRILWYLFFSVYWTSYEFGEKESPQENAKYYLIITIGLNVFAFYEILLYYGVALNNLFVILCFLPGIIFVNSFYFRHKAYIHKTQDFRYLQNLSEKRKRYTTTILVTLWSMAVVAFGALIRIP